MRNNKQGVAWLLIFGILASCSAYQGYRRAQIAEQHGDWDQAVLHYLELVDRYPNKVTYRTGLLRSKLRASQSHFEKGKRFQDAGALERAFGEYQQAVQLDPTNQYARVELEKLRDELIKDDDQRTLVSSLAELKEKTRGTRPQPPLLNPRATDPISLEFPKPVSVFDIYKALGKAFGINILFDPKLRDQQIGIELRDVDAQRALEILMRTAGHFYKVLDEQSIIVAEDNPQNRRNYEDLVIQTFFLSNAEVKDVMTMLRSLVGSKNIASNDQLNAIVLRDTADKVKVAERIIHTNDKARGEVVIDVELLQINSNKVRDLGMNLSQNFIVQSFDAPAGDETSNSVRVSDFEFINQGNWFVSIPNITYTFIKQSSDAELLASPQIRISDGEQATLHIGDRVPIPVTSFNTSQTIGSNIVPITSFQYQDIGIRLDLEPRIHHNKEISLKLQVEVSDLSGFVTGTGGQQQPIIATRTIESTIRLMNGETNFLAGLIRTGDNRTNDGIPGLSDIPVLGRLFSKNRSDKSRTDLVLTMTPHIIRTPDITEEDLLPIWVGTEANITFRGGSPRVESDEEGPFDEGVESDAERIREMIRRRIQNLPRGLQESETEEDQPTGVELAPSAAPGDVFGTPPEEENESDAGPRSLIFVPSIESPESAAVVDMVAAGPSQDRQRQPEAEAQAPDAPIRLTLRPETTRVDDGDRFDLQVVIEADKAVSHVPLTLEFDSEVIVVESVEGGDFLGSRGTAEVLSNHSRSGRVVIGASRLGQQEGVTGRGTVATLRMRAVGTGVTTVGFSRGKAMDASLAAVGPVRLEGARVVVTPPGKPERKSDG